jgi:hypothetical protein
MPISEGELLKDVTEQDMQEHELLAIQADALIQTGRNEEAAELMKGSPVMEKLAIALHGKLKEEGRAI